MSEYGQDQIGPAINTRVYDGQRGKGKGDYLNPHPPVGGWGKQTKNVFKKYNKDKHGKYKASEKKKEIAEKMSAYTMGTWKKVKGKMKKVRNFGEGPFPSGPQKAADAGNGGNVDSWLKKDWPKHK